jgi:hypothetical protein
MGILAFPMTTSSPAETAELLFQKIAREKAIKSKSHLPKSREDAARVSEALARRGVELTGAWLRLSPLEQLRDLVRSGPQREKALTKALKATTPAERKLAIDTLLRRGEGIRLLHEGETWIAAPTADVLDEAETKTLVELGAQLGTLLRTAKVGRKGASAIDRREVARFADTLTRLAAARPTNDAERLLRVIEASPTTTLVAVPELVRSSGLPADDAKRALLALDREGRIELRAESGIGTLSEADFELCPLGSDGFPFSYLRRKDLRA